MSQQLNVERILEVDPDILLSFGVDQIDSSLKRFNRMGIPTAFIGEWNEQTPLVELNGLKSLGYYWIKKKKLLRFLRILKKNI